MRQINLPPGWNEDLVQSVLKHYESRRDEEAIAEDEAAYEDSIQISPNRFFKSLSLARCKWMRHSHLK